MSCTGSPLSGVGMGSRTARSPRARAENADQRRQAVNPPGFEAVQAGGEAVNVRLGRGRLRVVVRAADGELPLVPFEVAGAEDLVENGAGRRRFEQVHDGRGAEQVWAVRTVVVF